MACGECIGHPAVASTHFSAVFACGPWVVWIAVLCAARPGLLQRLPIAARVRPREGLGRKKSLRDLSHRRLTLADTGNSVGAISPLLRPDTLQPPCLTPLAVAELFCSHAVSARLCPYADQSAALRSASKAGKSHRRCADFYRRAQASGVGAARPCRGRRRVRRGPDRARPPGSCAAPADPSRRRSRASRSRRGGARGTGRPARARSRSTAPPGGSPCRHARTRRG